MAEQGVLWRVVLCPKGSASVLSNRPGPMLGDGELSGWTESSDPVEWMGYVRALALAAGRNGKTSTAALDYLMTKNAELMDRLANPEIYQGYLKSFRGGAT